MQISVAAFNSDPEAYVQVMTAPSLGGCLQHVIFTKPDV